MVLKIFKYQQVVLLNLFWAALYYLSAYAGKLFSFPPSGASPIWPAAGVALAALLLYKHKALLGIIGGILWVQEGAFLDATSTQGFSNSFIMGAMVCLGSSLQAGLGFILIKRYVGINDPLIKDQKILRFLFLGGAVSCMVAASFSTATLFYLDAISVSELAANWFVWWIGDTMGVWIITPLLLIFLGQPKNIWQKRRYYISYPLFMLLAFVVIVFYYSARQETRHIKETFNHQVKRLHSAFNNELLSHIKVNEILKSFFDNSLDVSSLEFKQFTRALVAEDDGIKTLEWIPSVRLEERVLFEKTSGINIIEADKNHQHVLASQRAVYFPIQFVSPHKGNEKLLGFDVLTNPVAKKALFKARDTGLTTATEIINLIQSPNKKNGLITYSPLYHKNQPLKTIEDRRAALRGFVASVIRIDVEVAEIMEHISDLQLLVRIKDGENLLYNDIPNKNIYQIKDSQLNQHAPLHFANRFWEIDYLPSNTFLTARQSWGRWLLLFGCLLFTGLTGTVLLIITGRTFRTEEMVRIKTAALRKEVREREGLNRIFHGIASSKSLDEVLSLMIEQIEQENPEMLCSILLLSKDKRHLLHGASGRLPKFYTEAINGIQIGKGVGSCGTAAYLRDRIIVENIDEHPYWAAYLDLTTQANLHACWSEPIFSSERKVLGTFAIYSSVPKKPQKADLEKIDNFAQLASLAIEKKNAEEKISYLAFYDPLTALPNRRLLHDRLKQELVIVERYHFHGALMFLDLDHFKALNDTLGHQAGDELLIQVAKRLQECVREVDTVARLGGDEFVVLLKTSESYSSFEQVSTYALMIAKRIQLALYIPYALKDGHEHVVTSSIGVTLFGQNNHDAFALFKQADIAMYEAKNSGRNTYRFYSEEMARETNQRLCLEEDIEVALEQQQFEIHYQAQHNLKGHIVSAEALLRWRHPQRGLLMPTEFMSLCEESHLSLAIGEWVLNSVIEQLVDFPMLEHISLNVSDWQFYQVDFVRKVEALFIKHQLPPQTLMLELTETLVMKDIGICIQRLNGLQALGVRVAIDNFGSDYSSLANLNRLAINQIKIDPCFVREIDEHESDTMIVDVIMMVAKHLDLRVVGKGVETFKQLEYLHAKGCYLYQGYYFSKPLSVEDFSLSLAKEFNGELKLNQSKNNF